MKYRKRVNKLEYYKVIQHDFTHQKEGKNTSNASCSIFGIDGPRETRSCIAYEREYMVHNFSDNIWFPKLEQGGGGRGYVHSSSVGKRKKGEGNFVNNRRQLF